MNLARQESKKKKRRKWCRYERKHSMSAAHIDWTENPLLGLQACAILDDSSRMIIAGREYVHCNTHSQIYSQRKVFRVGIGSKTSIDVHPLRKC